MLANKSGSSLTKQEIMFKCKVFVVFLYLCVGVMFKKIETGEGSSVFIFDMLKFKIFRF